jgi:hypothetical protein
MRKDEMKANLFLIILLSLLTGTIVGVVGMTVAINGFNKCFYIIVMLIVAVVMGSVGDKLNKSLRQDIDKYVTEG